MKYVRRHLLKNPYLSLAHHIKINQNVFAGSPKDPVELDEEFLTEKEHEIEHLCFSINVMYDDDDDDDDGYTKHKASGFITKLYRHKYWFRKLRQFTPHDMSESTFNRLWDEGVEIIKDLGFKFDTDQLKAFDLGKPSEMQYFLRLLIFCSYSWKYL